MENGLSDPVVLPEASALSTPGTSPAPPARVPPSWIVGLAVSPFGLVVGFTITALPFLLTRQGVPLDRVAETSAVVMSPTFWGFLLCPVLDTGLTRRAYCWVLAVISAVCLALALGVLSPARLGLTTGLLLVAELGMVMYANANGGWVAEFLPDRLRGSVGGWTNVANLGVGALGAMAVMSLAPHLRMQWIGLGLGAAVVLGVLPTVLFPASRRSSFRFKQVFTDTLKATWAASRKRECLVGFALFLAPASSAAAINLFSGLGGNFHVSAHVVVLVTGGGVAIATSVGALLGGYAANRVSRGYLYLGAGGGVALSSLTLALTLHTPSAFVAGVLIYNALAGVSYAAFTALSLQLVGQTSAVASTQLGLFAAATNAAIVYMTWADGQGFKHFGVRGLFLVDGLASVCAVVPLLFLVRHELRRHREAVAAVDS